MRQILKYIRYILSGEYKVDNRVKYPLLCFGTALIHLVFVIVFAKMKVTVLFVYNIFIVLFYCTLGFVCRLKDFYIESFILILAEVLFHASLATVLLGFNFGFMNFAFTLVPCGFYMTFTLNKRKLSAPLSVMTVLITLACYFSLYGYMLVNEPVCDFSYDSAIATRLYVFNAVVTFSLLFVFSTLFGLEIKYMMKSLEIENRKLEEFAMKDPLTNLLNRRSMKRCIREMADEIKGTDDVCCFVMADIDFFKKVNDTYGHDCGDLVLVAIADIISENVRDGDYVCRWGGEEILMLLHAGLDDSCNIAERIRRSIAEKNLEWKGKPVHVTITMGLAAYEDGMDLQDAIRKADNKLYKGKRKGRNCIVA